MPPHRPNTTSYRGVRTRLAGTFYAEIRSGDERISLGTFGTMHEVARAYDGAAWQLGRPRVHMNFQDARNKRQAQELAPPPRLDTVEDRRAHCQIRTCLLVTERDECVMADWRARHPEDVAAEEEF
ncbi:unnamed protein product [Alopecurus aequalis]